MKVYLIGFMGCGKTTFGKKLANKMDFAFADLDKEIEQQTGQTVSSYFALNGEDAFRSLEQETLHQTASLDNAIISCGGGTPCFFDNMEWMRKNGNTIYLKVQPEFLFHRLVQRKEKRPLIANMDDETLKNYIHNKLTEREKFYLQAQQVIDPTSVKPRVVKEMLLHKKQS